MTAKTNSEMQRRSPEEEAALADVKRSIRRQHAQMLEKSRSAAATTGSTKSGVTGSVRSRIFAMICVVVALAGLGALLAWLIRTSPPGAAPVAWQTTASALGTLIAVAISVSVAIVESGRSRRARKESDALRQEQEFQRRREVAGRVAGWIEDRYSPNPEGSAYVRTVEAVLANASSEPVFDVNVTIGLAWPSRLSLGPLSIPRPLVTLPPDRELRWNVSIPLLAHDINPSFPLAVEMGFTDPSGSRWTRTFDGKLIETTGEVTRLFDSDDEEAMFAQIGRLDPNNPLAVAFAFINALTAEDGIDRDLFERTVAPEATGWAGVTDEQLQEIRDELSRYGVAAYVHYPAPHIAYVKIVANEHENSQVVVGDTLEIEAKALMLTFVWERGWRVFSYGGAIISPDRILFPEGELHDEHRVASIFVDPDD